MNTRLNSHILSKIEELSNVVADNFDLKEGEPECVRQSVSKGYLIGMMQTVITQYVPENKLEEVLGVLQYHIDKQAKK